MAARPACECDEGPARIELLPPLPLAAMKGLAGPLLPAPFAPLAEEVEAEAETEVRGHALRFSGAGTWWCGAPLPRCCCCFASMLVLGRSTSASPAMTEAEEPRMAGIVC